MGHVCGIFLHFILLNVTVRLLSQSLCTFSCTCYVLIKSLSRFFFFTSYTSFPLLLAYTGVAPWLPFPPTDDDHDTNAVGAHTQTDTEPTPVPQPRTQRFVHLFQSIPIPAIVLHFQTCSTNNHGSCFQKPPPNFCTSLPAAVKTDATVAPYHNRRVFAILCPLFVPHTAENCWEHTRSTHSCECVGRQRLGRNDSFFLASNWASISNFLGCGDGGTLPTRRGHSCGCNLLVTNRLLAVTRHR